MAGGAKLRRNVYLWIIQYVILKYIIGLKSSDRGRHSCIYYATQSWSAAELLLICSQTLNTCPFIVLWSLCVLGNQSHIIPTLLFTALIFHKSTVWWKFTILFSQSWQDCFWKFLQDIEVVGNSQFYFQNLWNLVFWPENNRVIFIVLCSQPYIIV